jgi:hypothetical protein
MLTETSRSYLAGDVRNGTTSGMMVSSEGLMLEDAILTLWLTGVHKKLVEIFGKDNNDCKCPNSSIKEELIRLLRLRNSL